MVRADILIHYLPEQVKHVDPAVEAQLKLRPWHLPRKSTIALSEPEAISPNDVVSVSVGVPDIRVKGVTKDLTKLG